MAVLCVCVCGLWRVCDGQYMYTVGIISGDAQEDLSPKPPRGLAVLEVLGQGVHCAQLKSQFYDNGQVLDRAVKQDP